MDKRSAILIIEDDPALRQGTAKILAEAGFQVFEAATGEDGFAAACREAPALVLLDVCLPDVSGLALCHRFKTNPALAGIYVLLISGRKTDTESLTEGLEDGADGYIVRPIANRELVARVRAMFRLKQAEEELRRINAELEQRVAARTEELQHLNAQLVAQFEQYQQSENKYRAMFEYMRSGVAVYDAIHDGEDFIFRDFNTAAERISNISRDRVIGQRLLTLFPNMDQFGLFAALQRVYRTGQPEHLPAAYYHDDMRSGWRENFIYKLPSGEVVAIYEDVTERKRAESVLQQKTDELDHFFDLALDLLCIADTEGNFRRLNLAWETTLGYSREELLSHRFLDFVHPDDVAATIEAVSRLAAQKTVLNFTNRYRCKDGSYRWIEWRSAPAGKRIYAAARDVTTHKLAEAEIQQLNHTLEARVQQRTAELEAMNRDLQHFVNAASHDLKTPLHGISRLATWLVRDYAAAFDARGRELAADLIQRVMRLDALLDGVLEYASLAQSAETTAPVALNEVLCYVLRELAPPPNIQIIAPENLPVIQGDARRIRKVFHHLLQNAIQFSSPAGGCVTITAQESPTQWTFCVADTGVGIDPKYHAKIFKLFQRLDPHDDSSTGIGLALVKKIVESAGGQIWVESTIGKGSAFYFTVPK